MQNSWSKCRRSGAVGIENFRAQGQNVGRNSRPSKRPWRPAQDKAREQVMIQKIKPFLWFDRQAEEAAKFYCSIFKNSKMLEVARYPEGGPAPAGSVMIASFELEGMQFVALNAGPLFKFTEAISFVVTTESQEETDYYWNKLTADGGKESDCGWLKDKFGLSWQITPKALIDLLSNPDKQKTARVMAAMMTMQKIDIAALQRAAQ
ncbi:MAG TPA: VOC family protein [Candidatus Acidoferrum sp.]|nr:VOC family protein [Candidatus Acidoferrum sp.]